MATTDLTTPTEEPPAEMPPTIMMALADVIDQIEDDDGPPAAACA